MQHTPQLHLKTSPACFEGAGGRRIRFRNTGPERFKLPINLPSGRCEGFPKTWLIFTKKTAFGGGGAFFDNVFSRRALKRTPNGMCQGLGFRALEGLGFRVYIYIYISYIKNKSHIHIYIYIYIYIPLHLRFSIFFVGTSTATGCRSRKEGRALSQE